MNKILLTALIGLAALSAVVWILLREPQVKVVESARLWKSFEMTRELKGHFSRVQGKLERRSDSLEYALSAIIGELAGQNDQLLRGQYDRLLQEKQGVESLLAGYADSIATADQSIHSRLAGYLQRFCEEKGIDLLILRGEDQSIFTGSDGLDCTDEAISYVNKKYLGE